MPKVFISYSHDNDEHRKKALSLSERLRADGIETRLDQYVNGTPPEGWPRWMLNQLDEANFVLVACTETYYRRFRGHEQPGIGKGADWEGALITQEIYDSRSSTTKFVPVFLGPAVSEHIPEPLRKDSYYALTLEDAYQNLYDFLLGQAGVEPRSLGELKIRPRQQGTALIFDASPQAPKIDISRIVKYAPENLIGREAELQLLGDAWNKAINGEASRPRVLTFVAMGGEGKTSLVAKWAAGLVDRNWPGCEAAFAWSFYSQGTSESASSDLFLKEALVFFGDEEMANSARHIADKGKRLAQLIGAKRALLIHDGVEPLQYAPTGPMAGQLKDYGISTLLKTLAANSRGLCVVTTRYSISDLKAFRQNAAPEIELKRLPQEAGVELLKSLGVKGAQREYDQLVEGVKGHALTLNLLGAYLRDAHEGDIRKRDLVKLEEADAEEQGGHAFRVMDAYVQWLSADSGSVEENRKAQRALAILRLMGLFDRPVSANCFYALLKAPAIKNLTELLVEKNDVKRNMALSRLDAAKLLTVNRDASGTLITLDTHPLLREYFAKLLREQYPVSWREAHRRIYKQLITTNEGERPTLEQLLPLYHAVAHGCLAGIKQQTCDEVYYARIQRRNAAYSSKKLGGHSSDLGAVACFFDIPWSRVSPALMEDDQAWLLNEAALHLHALGRLGEALEPMRAGLEMRVKQEDWNNAAANAHNLSELELTLGMLDAAISDAEQSVSYADPSGKAFLRMACRTTHANALHQAGQRAKAEALFVATEKMQAEHQPGYPLLYSVGGFLYCDLLLTAVERAAWCTLLPSHIGRGGAGGEEAACRTVSERAAQTLQWVTTQNWLLDIALDHLTLGRAALYAALLQRAELNITHAELEHAVDGLRQSGNTGELPRGLLTRAWLRARQGDLADAQADLDEAWEIAERGPMPLYQADILLHRARLFFREAEYPWRNDDGSPRTAKDDLAEARRLIEKHGYWRRKEELEDAEAVIGK